MSKLNKKFLCSIFIVLLFVGVIAFYLNSNFIERYYLYQEKQELKNMREYLISSDTGLEQAVKALEANEHVVIAVVPYVQDNVLLNARLKQAFYDKGISLVKYWLWDQDQEEIRNLNSKIKIYSQEKLNYSLLVHYLSLGDSFIAIAKTIPSIDKTLSLVNRTTAFIFAGAGCLLFLIISLLVHRIISPIQTIRKAAQAISRLEFKTIEIHTKDELEYLAEDINGMSRSLQESHQLLQQKNQQMKEFLANVSHDLKTPISLVKMYAHGMRDGLDDGTFIDTIIAQNNRMEKMVEGLLNLAKIQQQECVWQTVELGELLNEILTAYRLQKQKKEIHLECSTNDSLLIRSNQEAAALVLDNMLSNAVKYSADDKIIICLIKEAENCLFCIGNAIVNAEEIEINRIWEPFYVGEQSRNQSMSGTGLGLSIVKAVSEKYEIGYRCEIRKDHILFTFQFPLEALEDKERL